MMSPEDTSTMHRTRTRLERRRGRLHATLLGTYMSGILLLGLALNSALGWWWADPVTGLVIAAVGVKEGREAWRGEGCCLPMQLITETGADECGCSPGCTCC